MLVEKVLKNEINLDQFVTKELPFKEINDAFELLHSGKR